MDQARMKELEALCIQEQPPACTAACPMHVDARGMAAAIAKGDFGAARALYTKVIAFPSVISRICDAPCQNVCKRREIGESIRIRDLERACVEHAEPVSRGGFLPKRDKTVAVAGGGLSGLSAAVELARKGYKAVLFEAGEQLGGKVLEHPQTELPAECIENDLKILETLPVTIRLNERIGEGGTPLAALIEQYDAVYVATGSLTGFKELGEIDAQTLSTNMDKVFAGGRLRQEKYSPITALHDGRRAAISIDRLLQAVSQTKSRENEGAFETTLFTNTEGIEPQNAVLPTGPDGAYTRAEAEREAQRCIQCQCMECVKGCAYLAHYKSYPKQYVRKVYNNLSIALGIRDANEMINACSLCGQCAAICPNGLNMGEVCLDARRTMVRTNKMPVPPFEFALRDLEFSNSDAYFLARSQPGQEKSEYAFFPGCQLGASAPETVRRAYADLCARLDGGVALMLGCCGVIADWAGREQLFAQTLDKLKEVWESLGKPQVIVGCPTCYIVFRKHCPDMRVRGIWDVLSETGLPENFADGKGSVLAVQDACTTRYEPAVQDSIRSLAEKMGYTIEELEYTRERTQCCGYGGLTGYAQQQVGREMVEHCIEQSGSDYLAYCANCRDRVAKGGKRAAHLLELVYPSGEDVLERKAPGYSQRRENRERLKASLLREVWGESPVDPKYEIAMTMDEGVELTLDERMILREDIAKTLAAAEASGNRLLHKASGRYIASHRSGTVTYWVWYSPENGGFRVHNAYSHRMEIEGEGKT